MLECRELKKSFRPKEVLRGVSLRLNAGEVYGLVGENGAGKTTLMNLITGLLKPDGGEIFIDGVPVGKALGHRIGYMLDIPAMFEFMTAGEYLAYLASAEKYGREYVLSRSRELLAMVGLSDVQNSRISGFSRGMKQRMGIAAALFHNPDLILMDEPSSALDPKGRYEVAEIIRQLAAQGKTVLLSTHILSDVEKVCDRIGLLVNGSIKVEGSIDEVMSRYKRPVYFVVSPYVQAILEGLKGDYLVDRRIEGGVLWLSLRSEGDSVQLFSDVAALKLPVNCISVKNVSLEEIFLQETLGGVR